MRNLLAILASVSILVCAGCASNSDGSAKSPWAAGASAPKAKTEAPSVPKSTVQEREQSVGSVAPATSTAPDAEADVAAPDAPLLAAYPALSQANKEKAMAEIAATTVDSEPLPMPDEGKARVVAYNVDCSLVQFDTPTAFKVGEKVVLSKAGTHTLVVIVAAQDGSRYVAEEVDGVVDAPTLVPGDELDCSVWVNPEDVAAVTAAAEKAQKDSDDPLAAVEEDDYSEEEVSEEEEYVEEE